MTTASYDLKDVADVKDLKMDANQPIYLQRELDLLDSTIYKIERPVLEMVELIPKMEIVPIDQESKTKRLYTGKATASFDSPTSTGHQNADITMITGSTFPKYAYAGYSITKEEMMYANARGQPLETSKAELALRALEELANTAWQIGNAGFGWVGLFNQTNTQPLLTLPNGASGFSTWASKTAEEIIKDMVLISNYSSRNSKKVETANTIVLPAGTFELLDGKFFNGAPSLLSIDQVISARLAGRGVKMKIREAFDLETAAPGNAPMIIVYNDQKVSRVMSQAPTVKYSYETVNAVHRVMQMRFGEVVTMNPKSITYVLGA